MLEAPDLPALLRATDRYGKEYYGNPEKEAGKAEECTPRFGTRRSRASATDCRADTRGEEDCAGFGGLRPDRRHSKVDLNVGQHNTDHNHNVDIAGASRQAIDRREAPARKTRKERQ